nr:hypothetical protein BaRGS_001035 [Batillaria attramentaria]
MQDIIGNVLASGNREEGDSQCSLLPPGPRRPSTWQTQNPYALHINPQNVDTLLIGARFFNQSDVITMCKETLLDCNVQNALYYKYVADKHELEDIMPYLQDFVRANFTAISKTHSFLGMGVQQCKILLSDDGLKVDKELDVFYAARAWIEHNKHDRVKLMRDVMSCVRFVHISPEEIARVVEPDTSEFFRGAEGRELLLTFYRYHALHGSHVTMRGVNVQPPRKYVPLGIDRPPKTDPQAFQRPLPQAQPGTRGPTTNVSRPGIPPSTPQPPQTSRQSATPRHENRRHTTAVAGSYQLVKQTQTASSISSALPGTQGAFQRQVLSANTTSRLGSQPNTQGARATSISKHQTVSGDTARTSEDRTNGPAFRPANASQRQYSLANAADKLENQYNTRGTSTSTFQSRSRLRSENRPSYEAMKPPTTSQRQYLGTAGGLENRHSTATSQGQPVSASDSGGMDIRRGTQTGRSTSTSQYHDQSLLAKMAGRPENQPNTQAARASNTTQSQPASADNRGRLEKRPTTQADRPNNNFRFRGQSLPAKMDGWLESQPNTQAARANTPQRQSAPGNGRGNLENRPSTQADTTDNTSQNQDQTFAASVTKKLENQPNIQTAGATASSQHQPVLAGTAGGLPNRPSVAEAGAASTARHQSVSGNRASWLENRRSAQPARGGHGSEDKTPADSGIVPARYTESFPRSISEMVRHPKFASVSHSVGSFMRRYKKRSDLRVESDTAIARGSRFSTIGGRTFDSVSATILESTHEHLRDSSPEAAAARHIVKTESQGFSGASDKEDDTMDSDQLMGITHEDKQQLQKAPGPDTRRSVFWENRTERPSGNQPVNKSASSSKFPQLSRMRGFTTTSMTANSGPAPAVQELHCEDDDDGDASASRMADPNRQEQTGVPAPSFGQSVRNVQEDAGNIAGANPSGEAYRYTQESPERLPAAMSVRRKLNTSSRSAQELSDTGKGSRRNPDAFQTSRDNMLESPLKPLTAIGDNPLNNVAPDQAVSPADSIPCSPDSAPTESPQETPRIGKGVNRSVNAGAIPGRAYLTGQKCRITRNLHPGHRGNAAGNNRFDYELINHKGKRGNITASNDGDDKFGEFKYMRYYQDPISAIERPQDESRYSPFVYKDHPYSRADEDPPLPKPQRVTTVLALGGLNPSSVNEDYPCRLVEQFNPHVNAWSLVTKLPEPRHHHACAVLDDYVYLIGGSSVDMSNIYDMAIPTNRCYRYDPQGNYWTEIASMRMPRMYHAVAVLEGVLYAVGGQTHNDTFLETVEYYNPDLDEWGHCASFFDAVIGVAAVGLHERLYVIGGFLEKGDDNVVLGTVECYDPRRNSWITKRPLPSPRCHACVGAVRGSLFVLGGATLVDESDAVVSLDSVLRYYEAQDMWEQFDTLCTPRHDAGCCVMDRQ